MPPGSTPVDTENMISSLLVQPRQALFLSNGPGAGDVIINGIGIDAHNGPMPQLFSVTEMHGDDRTWEVEFAVTTWLNEAEEPNVLISNRWSMEGDTDQDWYTTRVIRGHATFDTKLLAGASPDSFRSKLILTVPTNFKRDSIAVTVEEDGAALDYSIIDREQPINLTAAAIKAGITRIEATNTVGIRNPGFEVCIGN